MPPGERAPRPGDPEYDEGEAWLARLPGPRWAWTDVPLVLVALGVLAWALVSGTGNIWMLVVVLAAGVGQVFLRRWWQPRVSAAGRAARRRRELRRTGGSE